jgi:hypothetical protein
MYAVAWEGLEGDLRLGAMLLELTIAGEPSLPPQAGMTWERFSHILDLEHACVGSLLAASAVGPCDFGLKVTNSFALSTTPEMDRMNTVASHMRDSARVLRADAIRAWAAGDEGDAVARLHAIYRAARHCADQHVVMFSMTASSPLISIANQTVRDMASSPRGLSWTAKKELLRAIDELGSADPDGLVRARSAERQAERKIEEILDKSQVRTARDIAATRKVLLGE